RTASATPTRPRRAPPTGTVAFTVFEIGPHPPVRPIARSANHQVEPGSSDRIVTVSFAAPLANTSRRFAVASNVIVSSGAGPKRTSYFHVPGGAFHLRLTVESPSAEIASVVTMSEGEPGVPVRALFARGVGQLEGSTPHVPGPAA